MPATLAISPIRVETARVDPVRRPFALLQHELLAADLKPRGHCLLIDIRNQIEMSGRAVAPQRVEPGLQLGE